jgi:hypothetical protein
VKSVIFGIANRAIAKKEEFTTEETCKAEMALALDNIVQNIQFVRDKKMEVL